MSRFKYDLTGLAEAARDSMGKPLELDIADVAEDPNQPRQEFDPAGMQELADSIQARGVKTPISVHADPARPGKYIVNHGARRLRASRLCGKPTIPAFVDEVYDAYDQVIENLQRENLTPMELAMFIAARIAAGDKKGEIAKNLGKGVQAITEYMALIEPPSCVEEAYAAGCTSPKTLYGLRRLHEKYPEQVAAWCASTPDITRRTIDEFADKLRHDVISESESVVMEPEQSIDKLRHDVILEPEPVPKVPELAPVVGPHAPLEPAEKLRHGVISEPQKWPEDLVMTKFRMEKGVSEHLSIYAERGQFSLDEAINRALKEFFNL